MTLQFNSVNDSD